ncbi:mRNA export factor GLE1-like [Limanda limanda]|uniref:mRNA export factor GLE1-like n=1 Tax=Limanda limanda TaxID=27771 RepID=UPI0029C8F506|nr:mRNA export factor GLE1-like [Limanda limanda]
MPSESLRRETLEALRNSKKGKISFDPHGWSRIDDILGGYKETISLSPQAGLILDRLGSSPLQTSCFLDSSSGHSSPGLSEQTTDSIVSRESVSDINAQALQVECEKASLFVCFEDAKDEDPETDDSEVSSLLPPPAISLLSPKAMEITGRIIKIEKEYREKAQVALRQRQEMQEKFVAELVSSGSEQLKCFEEFMELKRRQEFQSIRDMMDRESKESIGRQEKLKEEQRHRMKILKLRLREAEHQRECEAELESKWRAELQPQQAEGRERLQNLNTVKEEILQLNQLLEPFYQTNSELLLSSLSFYSTSRNQLCSYVAELVRKTAEGAFPSVEDVAAADRALHEMRAMILLLQEEVARVQEHKKGEEEALKKTTKEAARRKGEREQEELQQCSVHNIYLRTVPTGLQNSAEDRTLKWFKDLQDSAAQCAQSFEQLNSSKDVQTKKLKTELQKAANVPINQISSNSGSQLREIFDKIDKLLSGRSVVSGGKSVSTSQHPQGLDFVSYKLAKKFVKQGEEEVASHHEAAFPIAVVASGIWELHPRVGDLILAHLHKKCPYAVPHYPPMKDGTSVEEYQKILGYRVDDSGIEGQDSFLKRMSGMIRLYAAVIQLRWPYGSKQGSAPHSLNHGWRWLAQMLNMEPLADITATLLFDFLEVCGNALMKQYQSQFWKLILLLKEEYFPRVEAVTSSGQMGSVLRLKQFLETSLLTGDIKPPKGQLSSTFWSS